MSERTRPGDAPGPKEGSSAPDRGPTSVGETATGKRGPRPPDVRCDGGTLDVGLFETIPDPAARYVLEEGTPTVTEVNDAYVQSFDVDGDVRGQLETRLRTDMEREEPGEGLARVDDIVELVESAAAESHIRSIVRADTPRGEGDYMARVFPVSESDAAFGYLVLTDITNMRERTRELVEQRDRLDEFASIVSHDLRNPLEVAKIQLEAAANRGDDVHFEKVADAHERMERIVEDVLTLARQGRVIDEVDDATLSFVAGDAWDSISAPQASLEVDGDTVLKADGDRLQELLENLFRNAHEHGGADVVVAVGRTNDGFYVADDGPGIPEEDRDHVFEGGFSTNTEGTGLGLVIVQRIAEAHGWTVEVGESERGGARFDFSDVRIVG